MDDTELMKIFEEGAAAARARRRIGRWANPYIKLLNDAKAHREPTYFAQRLIDTWDDGWTTQIVKMRHLNSGNHRHS